jgi:acetoin utilization protein AcuB
MYVEKFMSSPVDTVTADWKLAQVAERMRDKGRRFLPVVDGERLIGLLTHRELERAEPSSITTLSVGEVNYLMSKITAGQIMRKQVATCTPKTLVEEAGHLIRQQQVGCLPVVEDERLIGIITEDDILDFFLAITGCTLSDTTRIAVHLPDRTGQLSALLQAINQYGGYIATVVSPVATDETGQRVAILRYRAEHPAQLDEQLRQQGYDLITEELPPAS